MAKGSNGESKINGVEKTTHKIHVDHLEGPIAKAKREARDQDLDDLSNGIVPLHNKASVRELKGIERKPYWRAGTANIVERKGLPKHLTITLDGMALQVPNDSKVIAWLMSSLDQFAKDEGAAGAKARLVDDPIKAAV